MTIQAMGGDAVSVSPETMTVVVLLVLVTPVVAIAVMKFFRRSRRSSRHRVSDFKITKD